MSLDTEKKDQPKMLKFVKPNKTEVLINDLPATLQHADKLGWKKVK